MAPADIFSSIDKGDRNVAKVIIGADDTTTQVAFDTTDSAEARHDEFSRQPNLLNPGPPPNEQGEDDDSARTLAVSRSAFSRFGSVGFVEGEVNADSAEPARMGGISEGELQEMHQRMNQYARGQRVEDDPFFDNATPGPILRAAQRPHGGLPPFPNRLLHRPLTRDAVIEDVTTEDGELDNSMANAARPSGAAQDKTETGSPAVYKPRRAMKMWTHGEEEILVKICVQQIPYVEAARDNLISGRSAVQKRAKVDHPRRIGRLRRNADGTWTDTDA